MTTQRIVTPGSSLVPVSRIVTDRRSLSLEERCIDAITQFGSSRTVAHCLANLPIHLVEKVLSELPWWRRQQVWQWRAMLPDEPKRLLAGLVIRGLARFCTICFRPTFFINRDGHCRAGCRCRTCGTRVFPSGAIVFTRYRCYDCYLSIDVLGEEPLP